MGNEGSKHACSAATPVCADSFRDQGIHGFTVILKTAWCDNCELFGAFPRMRPATHQSEVRRKRMLECPCVDFKMQKEQAVLCSLLEACWRERRADQFDTSQCGLREGIGLRFSALELHAAYRMTKWDFTLSALPSVALPYFQVRALGARIRFGLGNHRTHGDGKECPQA